MLLRPRGAEERHPGRHAVNRPLAEAGGRRRLQLRVRLRVAGQGSRAADEFQGRARARTDLLVGPAPGADAQLESAHRQAARGRPVSRRTGAGAGAELHGRATAASGQRSAGAAQARVMPICLALNSSTFLVMCS